MRRTVIIATAIMFGLLVAAPAWGQGRDPFEPREDSGNEQPVDDDSSGDSPFEPQEGSGGQEVAQETPDDPTEPTEPAEDPAVNEDGQGQSTLANTGFDVSTWGGIAYLLIVLGAAAIVAGRTFAPVLPKRRR